MVIVGFNSTLYSLVAVTLKERRLNGGDAADWTAWGTTLGKVSKLVSSPKSPDNIGGLIHPYIQWVREGRGEFFYLRVKRSGVNLIIHFKILTYLIILGALTLLLVYAFISCTGTNRFFSSFLSFLYFTMVSELYGVVGLPSLSICLIQKRL